MIRLALLCCGMENAVLSRAVAEDGVDDLRCVMLPDPQIPLREDALYVGTGEQVRELFRRAGGKKKVTAFSAGPLPEGTPVPDNCGVVAVDLPLAVVHNHLTENLRRYQDWQLALAAVPEGLDYLSDLLRRAAELVDCSFLFFDRNCRLVASGQTRESFWDLSGADLPRQLTPNQIDQLFGRLLSGALPAGKADVQQVNRKIFPVLCRRETVGYLLTVEYNSAGYVESFSMLLREVLAAHLQFGKGKSTALKDDPFHLFIERMPVYYQRNPGQIMMDMGKLRFPAGPWVRFLLISPGMGKLTLTQLFSRVQELFSGSNITIYEETIVVLLSCKGASSADEETYGLDALETLLEESAGFALLSNSCILEKGVRTEYIQSAAVLKMLPKLRFPYEKRCGRLNRYLSYYSIHICATHMMEEFGHDRLVYLVYPEIVALTRYDMENNTDLRDLLFYYVSNDCNVTKTAEFLHMHRNTVLYKLNKIKELVGINLDTGLEKAGILHSCQTLRYMERIQNQHGRLLESAIEYTSKHPQTL